MRVDPDELRTAASDLRAIAADLIEEVRTLSAEAQSLPCAAAAAHLAAWSDTARRLVCALGDDAYLLSSAAIGNSTFARAVA